MKQQIKNLVLSHKEELITTLEKLVNSQSVSSGAKEGYPHGKAVAETLDLALSICDELGFKTKNIDYEAGYAEIGEGEKLIGILGHLDVVPAGNGWESDPFKMTIKDDVIYGRGVMDDKGPVVANMIALKILKQLKPNLKSRVRLIMGCDEERGSSCLKHYVEKEGHIDMGYTPDGDFPLVFGEKGILHFDLIFPTKIHHIFGGEVYNACISEVTVSKNQLQFDEQKFVQFLNENNIKHIIETEKITVYGVAAHGSTPEKGINAASYLMEALYVAGCKDEAVLKYNELIELGYNGENLGINHEDRYGNLTLNVGKVRIINGEFVVSCDVRYPITTNGDKLEKTLLDNAIDYKLNVVSHAKALYVDPESDLVKVLLTAYREVTNDLTPPLTIGGGTYARGINNCVAFGAMRLDREYNIHNVNEEISISELLELTEIYVNALLKMVEHFEV